MLDIVTVRREPERVRRSAVRRGLDASFVDDILRYDEEYRSALAAAQRAAAEKNECSARIAHSSDKAAAAAQLRPQIDALSETIEQYQERARSLSPDRHDSPLHALLSGTPNLLADSVPDGSDERQNVVLRSWGQPQQFPFDAKSHWEIGEKLGILDLERAVKLSGSRFSVLKGAGARLSRALAQFFLDRASAAGYLEVSPPLLVNRTTMWATGQLSKFADAMFSDSDAGLFMIPTAEVPLTALRGGEMIAEDELPARYAAYTPCFRKEAGAAGKDTRGLIRQHQFEKVELVWLAQPESSFEALERLTHDAEVLLQSLNLPYRVISLCAGDTGFTAAKTYDLEVWLPSAGAYREISSCSNCTDFQSRRADIRFRRDAKARPAYVHTLNGSGLAIGRTWAAVLENYQRADGSVAIPPVLQPYTNFDAILA